MKGNNFFIQQYHGLSYNHGGVGYSDMEKILVANGYLPLNADGNSMQSGQSTAGRLVRCIRLAFSVPRNAVVVFIYPMYARMSRLLIRILLTRGIRCQCILADIDGVKDGDPVLLENELNWLGRFRDFIVHNPVMETWLRARLGEKVFSPLQFFDFLSAPASGTREKSATIVFAGNLGKSGFLRGLDHPALASVHFNLYGPGQPQDLPITSLVTYKGAYPPYELVNLLEGSYGLVWDGESIHGPAGGLGIYMGLISQHKLSLYILAGLPVIINSTAACAGVVVSEGIGLACDDLTRLPGILASVTDQQYASMREKMIPFAQRISSGRQLTDALKKISH
ncbi:MAG: hypothetical protein EOO09_09925 [Chitinophagaceae bacterium]|nr:MAG: hypothetical protein EOO09_09925 [Chitinophagaceae bacterium]